MSDIILILLFELVILGCALGLVFRYREALKQQYTYRMQGHIPSSGCFSGCSANFVMWVFLIGMFVVLFGFKGVTNSYYDYLTLGLLLGTLALVWFTTLPLGLIAESISPSDGLRPSDVSSFDRKYSLVMALFGLTTSVCVLAASLFLIIPGGIATTRGLVSGPEFAQGIVQKKTSSYDRSGTSYYADVNDQHFHVPNGKWWNTFTKGATVTYAYNPHAGLDGSIFPSDEINFTLSGAWVICTGLLLWYITMWTSIGGWQSNLRKSSP